jgi:DNA-binding CsgD family transcriptional regulator
MRLAEDIVMISEEERQAVLYAIQAAMKVCGHDQFLEWLRGPFRAALPHESIVWLDIDAEDVVRRIDSLHHNEIGEGHDGEENPRRLGESRTAFVAGLAGYFHRRPDLPGMFDAAMLDDLHRLEAPAAPPALLRNALMHRSDFLSGDSRLFVLLDIPEHCAPQSRYLLQLLSSHLKMALSQALELPAPENALGNALGIEPRNGPPGVEITGREREILGLMATGQSNQQISVSLGISAITLKKHVCKIYRKLDVQHRNDAIVRFRLLAEQVPQKD